MVYLLEVPLFVLIVESNRIHIIFERFRIWEPLSQDGHGEANEGTGL
jgi:hypothetical protein